MVARTRYYSILGFGALESAEQFYQTYDKVRDLLSMQQPAIVMNPH